MKAIIRLVGVLVLLATNLALADEKPEAKQQLPDGKLHGTWRGGACMGELTIRPNGTFQRDHYSPGNNKLTGTWKLTWDALPPTLVLSCTDSDDADFIDKQEELKLTELNDEALAFQYPGDFKSRYVRIVPADKKELAVLQGTWIPLQHEEHGEKASGEFNFKQIIKDDKITFLVNGEVKAEGKVVIDVTHTPNHLDFQFRSGQVDSIIYVRAGNYVIYCGNRDSKNRPTEFTTNTDNGGDYLMTWKIER